MTDPDLCDGCMGEPAWCVCRPGPGPEVPASWRGVAALPRAMTSPAPDTGHDPGDEHADPPPEPEQ